MSNNTKKKLRIGVVLWLLMKRSVDNLRCNENFSLDGLKSTRSSESEAEREEFDTEEAEVLSGSGKLQTRGGGEGGGRGGVCGSADLAKNLLGFLQK